MKIAEIYVAQQGEGRLTGTESTFVRVGGCNLRCSFCDTPFASWYPEGEHWTVEQIAAEVAHCNRSHVVLTGGEPMLFDEIAPLTQALSCLGTHITIETAGTVYQSVVCDLMSISPKLRNSRPDPKLNPEWHQRHEALRDNSAVIQRLMDEYDTQLKFVVSSPRDIPEIQTYLRRYPALEKGRILLMPEGKTREELASKAAWLVPLCAEWGFTYCPRMQIEWYGALRRT